MNPSPRIERPTTPQARPSPGAGSPLPFRFPSPPASPPQLHTKQIPAHHSQLGYLSSDPASPISSPLHSTPPRSDSLPLERAELSPRLDSLPASAGRSPRLGQATFDASLGSGGPESPLRVVPRKLFQDEEAHPYARPGRALNNSDIGLALSHPALWEGDKPDPLGAQRLESSPAPSYPTYRPASLSFTPKHGVSHIKQSSVTSDTSDTKSEPLSSPPSTPAPPKPSRRHIQPTLGLLFSLNSRSTQTMILTPALILSILTGLAPPITAQLVGLAYGSFTDYANKVSAPGVTAAEIAQYGHTLQMAALKYMLIFIAVAVGVAITWTASTTLWVINGERTAQALRREVFKGVGSRSLAWFDTGMGVDAKEEGEGEEASTTQGAGGVVGQFTKGIDDTRMAANATCGLMVQYLTSFVAAIALSFYREWRLTLVILSSIPILTFVVGLTERMCAAYISEDRIYSAREAARADRALGAITTVKAFNAHASEAASLQLLTSKTVEIYIRLHNWWGVRTGVSNFFMYVMFVEGFWFGSWLVQSGKSTATNVNTCFWACLLATGFLQSIVPLMAVIETGKVAMAGVLELAREFDDQPEADLGAAASAKAAEAEVDHKRSSTPVSPHSNAARKSRRISTRHERLTSADISRPLSIQGSGMGALEGDSQYFNTTPASPAIYSPSSHPMASPRFIPLAAGKRGEKKGMNQIGKSRTMGKLRPATFSGELSLRNITFHYPSRPHPARPALENVSLYLAPSETTYIVGGSGSGKSTVGSLLMALYQPDSGRVEVDEQALDCIDEDWLRSHVACVSQGASVLFDGTVHDNVAIGVVGQLQPDGSRRKSQDVTREEVIQACTGALIHDFIQALPMGYETVLSGEKGQSLSGGQRQRLAIARAWVRDPTVLILDEATSALDALSRHLVNEALKTNRKHKTTIVITHDLTPIGQDDFVYVMQDGRVVEQGYRVDLETHIGGPWHTLAHTQQNGTLAEEEAEEEIVEEQDAADIDTTKLGWQLAQGSPQMSRKGLSTPHGSPTQTRRSLHDGSPRPNSVHSTPKFRLSDAFEGSPILSGGANSLGLSEQGGLGSVARASREIQAARRISAAYMDRSPSADSVRNSALLMQTPPRAETPALAGKRRNSIYTPDQFGPRRSPSSSPARYHKGASPAGRPVSAISTTAIELAGQAASQRRGPMRDRIKHTTMIDDADVAAALAAQLAAYEAGAVVVDMDPQEENIPLRQISLSRLALMYYPTVPNKWLLWFGLILSMGVGACTPVFSTLLSSLMVDLGTSKDTEATTKNSLLVLLIAFIVGIGSWAKFLAMETVAIKWIASLRLRAFKLLLAQDKAFFDKQENSTAKLIQILIKDHEDARTIVGTVIGNMLVIFSMITIGLSWAFAVGWELTLVGLGLAPIFVVATGLQARVLQVLEGNNRLLRQEVADKFHQTVSNIRAIRSMNIAPKLEEQFDIAAEACFQGAKRSAPMMGFGNALSAALTYLAEGIMFYVGAVLIAKGRLTFASMNETFSLFIFAVTFSAQIMTYLPAMTKSHRALIDLTRVLELDTNSQESEGRMTFPIAGEITFQGVEFSYPARPDVRVLKGLNFTIQPGQCVGIVGPSGSGKSTVTALMQRLYEPSAGRILLDGRPLSRVDVNFLRDHIAIVSQHPALFDSSVSANISYGLPDAPQDLIERAARQAHAHEFITQLPQGYNTLLGENASLISGGQAQRLQIARALARPRELLILDECTSALDATNQEAVMNTIRDVKRGRTTLVVTHKLKVMEMCDWLLVVEDGQVIEQGTAEELKKRKGGVFATLAGGGEWQN